MAKITRTDRVQQTALVSLVFNILYCVYHIVFGALTASWWFLTIGIYYAVLSIIRFVVLRHKGNNRLLIRFTGAMLIVLSVSLVGTVILAFVKDRGTVFPLIAMLAIATYTFTKITLATIKWIKARRSTSAPTMICLTIRNFGQRRKIPCLQRGRGQNYAFFNKLLISAIKPRAAEPR